jgi:DUF4097 and DUF4098 domain-containing protein YvlB
MNKAALVSAALLWTGLAAADDDCAFTAERTAELSTDGIERLEIRAGAGELQVEGESGLRSVHATGQACARSEAQLERVQIQLEREGDTLVLHALPEDDESFNPRNWFGGARKLDLTVKVPAALEVDIEDSSGSTRVANVAGAQITDGSGDLEIENLRGGLKLVDGSGEITIRGVQGSVRIEDGSGDFSLTKVVGDVIVAADGSGAMEIIDVQGNVTVGNDGSGDIRIELVSGSVRIEDDGSGGIDVRLVQHDVIIDDDGSGAIVVDNIQGDFIVGNSGSGGVEHENVRGRVRVASEEIDTGDQSELSEPDASEDLEVEK